MRQTLWSGLLVVLACGWTDPASAGTFMSGYFSQPCPDGCSCSVRPAQGVPSLVGPYGQPVEMVYPYTASPPSGEAAARAMLSFSVPPEVQMALMAQNGGPPSAMPGAMGFPMPPGGMGMMGGLPGTGPIPPGLPSLPPGMSGSMSTPGGGVMQVGGPGYGPDSGLLLTQGRDLAPKVAGPAAPFPVQRTEVRFATPAGMKISWFTTQPDGRQGFGPQSLETPAGTTSSRPPSIGSN